MMQRWCFKWNQFSKHHMKYFILFGVIAIIFFLGSCKKDISSNEGNISILGKWNIVTDSSFSGVGLGNHEVNYAGQPGDYFDFSTNGKLYIREKGNLSTFNYTPTSDTTMIIDSFGIMLNGVPDTSSITNLTAHNATI